jgi:hypothetical protein
VRYAGGHRFGDHAHRQSLQSRQYVASEVYTVERPIIPPRGNGFALLRGSGGSAALRFTRGSGIVARCAHSCDLRWTRGAEARDNRALRFLAPIGKALIAE